MYSVTDLIPLIRQGCPARVLRPDMRGSGFKPLGMIHAKKSLKACFQCILQYLYFFLIVSIV